MMRMSSKTFKTERGSVGRKCWWIAQSSKFYLSLPQRRAISYLMVDTMGSPLGPVLANIFMCHFEEKWVLNNNARPSIWFRYVDDTFTLFDSKNTATQFLHYLNSCHANIKFTVEFEENSTIPFLDILIKRHNHTFSTSIYRKKTFTGLYTKWDSFTPN